MFSYRRNRGLSVYTAVEQRGAQRDWMEHDADYEAFSAIGFATSASPWGSARAGAACATL